MSPPVRLVDYVVERFDFAVNPAFRSDKASATKALEKTKLDLNLELDWSGPDHLPDDLAEDIGRASDDVEVFIIEFTVNINDREGFEEESQYRVCLKLDGFLERVPFSQIEDIDKGDYLRHSVASGVSILYGAARNIVSSMTAQSPYGKLILPSISPTHVTDQIMELRRKKQASRENPDAGSGH